MIEDLTPRHIIEAMKKLCNPYPASWEELFKQPPPWKTSMEYIAKRGIPNEKLSEFC